MTFNDLGLSAPLLRSLKEVGYSTPTPIQEQSIPILLRGNDLLGCAQTGTGKTAAFSLPIIQLLHADKKQFRGKRDVRALIVTPTRELAIQIGENFSAYEKYTRIRNTVIFGGVKQGRQVEALSRGVDVLVATPGRLLDLIGQGIITLRHIEYFVLDEADRMLDMGFIHDIRKLLKLLPRDRQSLFFSATMPKEIVDLSNRILDRPEMVTIKPEQATAERVDQSIYFIHKRGKIKLLTHLLKTEDMHSTLVFSRTKHGANKIVRLLGKAGIESAAIHGNKSQTARQKALKGFKDGSISVLVATDIAARGIDVADLSHVVNYDLPNIPETYVHRIGRTGRAGASGIAISFCNEEERAYLKTIQKLIKQEIPVIEDHPFTDIGDAEPQPQQQHSRQGPPRRNRGQGNRNQKNQGEMDNNSNPSKNKRRRWRPRKKK